MATRKKWFVVRAKKFDGYTGILFLMDSADSRVGTDNYEVVTSGRLTTERVDTPNGHRARVFLGDNGARYYVFSDRSAKAF